jgi:murein L,D-transpeptidase YafK
MLENIKNIISYRLKILEIQFQTWKNSRAISKAYGEESKRLKKRNTVPKRLIRLNLRKIIRPAVYGIGALAGCAILSSGIYVLVKYRPVHQPELTIAKHSENSKQNVIPETPKPPVAPVETTVVTQKQEKSQDPSIRKTTEPDPEDQSGAPVSSDYKVILANKASHIIYLLGHQNGHWDIIRQYPIATGQQSGPKQNAGDKRTPVGNYYIIGRKEKSELSAIYGPLSYVLNYPNEEDRKQGRTGQGIWIHGTDKDSTPDNTSGCLALSNRDLIELSTYLGNGIGTPVVIVDDSSMKSPVAVPKYVMLDKGRGVILEQQKISEAIFKELLVKWKKAWESKDINLYEEFYSKNEFNGQGLTWPAWREKKIRTFELYKKINVSIEKIKITDISETSAVIKFIQIYQSDLNRMENGKKLVCIKENGKWKISREDTFPKEELL